MAEALPESVARVARFLAEAEAEARLQEFPAGTPTAEDAALAIGCQVDQIVKSILLDCEGMSVLVLVPGSRRADTEKVAQAMGRRAARVASPAAVREATGFEVGGVAPFPLTDVRAVLADQSLLAWEVVWIGAGSDRHMAGLAPAELIRLTRARTLDLCADRPDS